MIDDSHLPVYVCSVCSSTNYHLSLTKEGHINRKCNPCSRVSTSRWVAKNPDKYADSLLDHLNLNDGEY